MKTTISPEEISAMARESGLTDPHLGEWMIEHGNAEEEIKKFAALVAEKAMAMEREACALVCEGRQTPGTGSVAILGGAADAIRARCATR